MSDSKFDILIVGVGGQGVLLASEIISQVAMDAGLDIKKSEVHGMSQRGGVVSSHVKIAEKVYSPVIHHGQADVLMSFEQAEALRASDWIKKDGLAVVSHTRLVPAIVTSSKDLSYPDNPIAELQKKIKRTIPVDADKIALELGNPRLVNTILLGVLSNYTPFDKDQWVAAIKKRVKSKFIDIKHCRPRTRAQDNVGDGLNHRVAMSLPMLIINPGSTSTKIALFDGNQKTADEVVRHDPKKLAEFDNVADQFDFRMEAINAWIDSLDLSNQKIKVVVGRGAPLRPLEGGSYEITETMLEDVRTARYSNHASNLGPIIAHALAKRYGVPSLISDPITVDNFTELARISGVPEIKRKCRSHALNIKEVSRREAAKLGKQLDQVSFVTAHMGGGISVAALRQGQVVDVNDGLLGMGPFSPDRAGALPIGGVVELCFSGEYTKKELIDKLSKKSGLVGYLGEADLRRVEEMIDNGDKKAKLCFDAMAYQVAKEIGVAATVLRGDFEAIILTGGMANSEKLTDEISKHVTWMKRVVIVPGEFEMEALAAAGVRFLTSEEKLKAY